MEAPIVFVLAAGKGTRMHSEMPKVLHALAGKPLLGYVLTTARALAPSRIVVVIGHGAPEVRKTFPDPDLLFVEQTEQLGTAHAVRTALDAMNGEQGTLLVLNGDVPLVESDTLTRFLNFHHQQRHAVTLLSTRIHPATGYGRIVRDSGGGVLAIVEEGDADDATRRLDEINAGIYALDLSHLPTLLSRVVVNPRKGEYYLTDIVALAREAGLSVGAYLHSSPMEVAGVNSRAQLSDIEVFLQRRMVRKWQDAGVTVVDPASCHLSVDVRLGRDTILHPHVVLGPGVEIGEGCEIGPFAVVEQSRIGPGCRILPFSHLEGALLEQNNPVGPFARLRPGAELADKARVGNFVEIKKARIGAGSKINHLSYIGDAELGVGVNVGAGTITCNYDGVNKHRTLIGDRAFIGSDTQFVAPVKVGEDAIVGAGTTVTTNVPDRALAVSRTPQKNIQEYRKNKEKQRG